MAPPCDHYGGLGLFATQTSVQSSAVATQWVVLQGDNLRWSPEWWRRLAPSWVLTQNEAATKAAGQARLETETLLLTIATGDHCSLVPKVPASVGGALGSCGVPFGFE